MPVIAFAANEAISIVENAGLMGPPIPEAITKVMESRNTKANQEDEKK